MIYLSLPQPHPPLLRVNSLSGAHVPLNCPVGKASFSEEKLTENFNALMEAIVKAKPSALKGQYLRSISLSTTMGPGVKVSTAKY